jgi:hypothetical protein
MRLARVSHRESQPRTKASSRHVMVINAVVVACWMQVCALPGAIGHGDTPADAKTAASVRLEAIARELIDGLADGDWAAWERHTSDDLLYTTEFGRTLTKKELRSLFRRQSPEPRRALSVSVVGIRSRGDAAVLVYEVRAHEEDGIECYRVTDTYWRVEGRWQLVASHAGRVATERDLAADANWGCHR